MKRVVHLNGLSSTPSDIKSGVKQSCVFASSLFGRYFAVRPKAKTRIRTILTRDILFADVVALTADILTLSKQACKVFGLKINPKTQLESEHSCIRDHYRESPIGCGSWVHILNNDRQSIPCPRNQQNNWTSCKDTLQKGWG